jgi:leader peptidase (prepilin peptidase)/N-methyltransferase
MEMMYYFCVFAFFSFVLGTLISSFLNVCIWRLPRGESVVSPPSHCPKCNARIKWYRNIPVISWLALRGKCPDCKEPISPRYVYVEFLGGVLFLLAYLQWGMPFFLRSYPMFGLVPYVEIYALFASWLVIAGLMLGSFIDLDHFYLPDRVTIGGMILGVPASYLIPELQGCTLPSEALKMSLIGMSGAFLFLWGIGALASKVFKKEAMGFGDVKLLGAVGAFFGPVAALFTLIVSALVGSIVGVSLLVRGRAKLGGFTAVPYGPFIAIGVLVWMYWGPIIVNWYLRLYVGN